MNHDYSRRWPDPQEQWFSNPLLLDRHRILHATSFRRLGYKTQVFLPLEADHFRTRLTHTIEVAHVASLLACRFDANALLAEVISLAHDLGHGPFGHSSEAVLNQLMTGVGGFEHNAQSIRVVEYLEGAYPWFRGLNLTRTTLEGMAAHNTPYDRPGQPLACEHLEGQLVNWADRLAFNMGDLEDAIGADFITPQQLQNLTLYRRAFDELTEDLREKPVHALRRILMESIQQTLINALELQTVPGGRRVTMQSDVQAGLEQMEAFLMDNVYRGPQLTQTSQTVQAIISRIFNRYREQPDLMPRRYLNRQSEMPLDRIIGDYLSGMTDRFCLKVYRQLYGADDMLLTSIKPVIGIGSETEC